MSEKIKRLKRELKYKGAIVDFYQDTMEIDGTHTATWDFISHKGAAAVVPVTEDGKILMVRQYRNALERYTLEVPAGALDAAYEPRGDSEFFFSLCFSSAPSAQGDVIFRVTPSV